MLVSHSQKFVFVHIQKTGGSTIKRLLGDRVSDLEQQGAPHSPLREARGIEDDYFRFAFVRNPWARLVSWYSMIRQAADYRWYDPYLTLSAQRRDWIREHRRQVHTNELWKYVTETCSSFEGFIRHCTDEVEVFDDVFYSFTRNQVDYISDENGSVAVNFIGRAETFSKDTKQLFSYLGLDDPEVPRVNASDHTHYSDYYTPETAEIVRQRYQRDIQAFGYDFSPAEAPVAA